MRGGRKLKPTNSNSVAYLVYKYTLLTTFLPSGKKIAFTSANTDNCYEGFKPHIGHQPMPLKNNKNHRNSQSFRS